MAIAHPDHHAVMIASFLQIAEGHDVIQETSFRCNIDGTWRRMNVQSLNLLEQDDIGAVISTYVGRPGRRRDPGDRQAGRRPRLGELAPAAARHPRHGLRRGRQADRDRRSDGGGEDFRLLADESPAAVFRCDDQGRVTFHNARWTDLIGVDDDVIHLRGIVHPDASSDLDRELAAALADTASEPRSFELRAASDDRILAFRCRSIADVDPARRRIVGSVDDVTDTVRLRDEASHDPLTGLINGLRSTRP